MKRLLILIILTLMTTIVTEAQERLSDDGFTVVDDEMGSRFNSHTKNDTTKNKKIPKGMFVWKVDDRFGERQLVDRDTLQHLFMNSFQTTGRYMQYNTTGNLGSPRDNRIFADRKQNSNFIFANAYDFILQPISEHRFTNTLSPITNLGYASCGDKIDGEDFLQVKFAVNANKRFGAGMRFDYFYGRGIYQNQSTALFNWTFWQSYLGKRYQNHFIFSVHHLKFTENGGIENDEYITHPESFNDKFMPSEIPTVLHDNYNQFDGSHAFLTHRYNVGFYKKVPMTPEEIEARKFAIEAEKEQLDKERQAKEDKNNSSYSKSTGSQAFGGRPSDAKIAGDLPLDSITGKIDNQRIAVNDTTIVDSLVETMTVQKEDTSWLKEEYVPVTSFIHTVKYDNYRRVYRGNFSPKDFYLSQYNTIDALESKNIYDETKHFSLRNTFAVAMLEGFNKWAKSGLKVFAAHELDHYELPDSVARMQSYNESTVFIGGQIIKTQGRIFHYNATAELGTIGKKIGDLKLDVDGEVNIPLFGDTTSIKVNGFFHRELPSFIYRNYHSMHFWWDETLSSQMHTHLEGKLNIQNTNTTLRAAYDNIQNYTYFGVSYNRNPETFAVTGYQVSPRQSSRNISLVTLEAYQDLKWGILNWENRITFQKCSEQTILPVPMLNVWTNLYLDFKIARVLSVHFGAEATYFTEYEAPEYTAQLSSFAVQENADVRKKIGNYPFVNVYANFVLKGCRFYAMMTHVNAGNGNRNYFTTPHHPMNDRVFHIGLSWNFYN